MKKANYFLQTVSDYCFVYGGKMQVITSPTNIHQSISVDVGSKTEL
jgi:hypothetical protein